MQVGPALAIAFWAVLIGLAAIYFIRVTLPWNVGDKITSALAYLLRRGRRAKSAADRFRQRVEDRAKDS